MSSKNNDKKKNIDERDFVSLISTNQRRIFAYIITLVPNRSDAEEIMQETTLLMWEKRNDFVPETDFIAWGNRIAYYKIMNYRRKAMRQRKVVLDEQQFVKIEEQANAKCRQTEDILYKLDDCIKKLPKSDRKIIYMKYSQDINAKKIASQINKSVRSIYLSISRIHGLLLRCIEGTEL